MQQFTNLLGLRISWFSAYSGEQGNSACTLPYYREILLLVLPSLKTLDQGNVHTLRQDSQQQKQELDKLLSLVSKREA